MEVPLRVSGRMVTGIKQEGLWGPGDVFSWSGADCMVGSLKGHGAADVREVYFSVCT